MIAIYIVGYFIAGVIVGLLIDRSIEHDQDRRATFILICLFFPFVVLFFIGVAIMNLFSEIGTFIGKFFSLLKRMIIKLVDLILSIND